MTILIWLISAVFLFLGGWISARGHLRKELEHWRYVVHLCKDLASNARTVIYNVRDDYGALGAIRALQRNKEYQEERVYTLITNEGKLQRDLLETQQKLKITEYALRIHGIPTP